MELEFANLELQRLYADNIGADDYTVETIRAFRRRIRHIEAAKDLNDLQCLRGVRYKRIEAENATAGSLALTGFWRLVISERDGQAGKQIVIHEMSEDLGGQG
jgi:plasmid maintenance system killer protein